MSVGQKWTFCHQSGKEGQIQCTITPGFPVNFFQF